MSTVKNRMFFVAVFAAIIIICWLIIRSHVGKENSITLNPASEDTGRTILQSSNSIRMVTNGISKSSLKKSEINPDVVPIVFYGKVVDEKESLVPQADIEFCVNDTSREGLTKYHVQSDGGGLFAISGIKGGGMTIQVSKEDYYAARSEVPYFYYSPLRGSQKHVPDPDNPVIFRLRKKGESASLIERYAKVLLPRDGTPVRFDLLEGTVSKRGQMELRAWKSDNKDVQQRFDWRMIISVSGGGLKETNEEFPFLAPEAGYIESLEINMPVNLGNQWQLAIEKQLYVIFGNPPKYARINFRTRGNNAYFYMDYWLNPSGSRNLEFDPAKQINK